MYNLLSVLRGAHSSEGHIPQRGTYLRVSLAWMPEETLDLKIKRSEAHILNIIYFLSPHFLAVSFLYAIIFSSCRPVILSHCYSSSWENPSSSDWKLRKSSASLHAPCYDSLSCHRTRKNTVKKYELKARASKNLSSFNFPEHFVTVMKTQFIQLKMLTICTYIGIS